MILKAFALLDTKVGAFHAPFFVPHVAVAVRAVVELASDARTVVGRHPADFCIVELGLFDDNSGVLTAISPINHGLVATFLADPGQPAGGLFGTPQSSNRENV